MDTYKAKLTGQALAARRWAGHVTEPTQPRRLKVETIKRVKAFAAQRGGMTFDAAIVALLEIRNAMLKGGVK